MTTSPKNSPQRNGPPAPVAAALVVCEQTGSWAASLRRDLTRQAGQVVETRSLDECRQRLAAAPGSLAAIELRDANIMEVLVWLAERRDESPAAPIIVLAQRGLEHYESLVREAGAVHFVPSPRSVDSALAIARRWLADSPGDSRGELERIWARLPWEE